MTEATPIAAASAAAMPAATPAVMTKAMDILHQVFGYQQFRGLQAETIELVLQGQDVLVLMPTGGGKSLCYQIPALVLPGTALVISPLIALMQDQVDALQAQGIAAAYLNSSLDQSQQDAVYQQLRAGALRLLYVAPERILQPRTLALLQTVPLSLIAIDEAHCVSQWGHDFRADYLQLDQLAGAFPAVPRVALTATADARTQDEICTRLALHQPKRLVAGFDRPNIQYQVATRSQSPRSQLLQFLQPYRDQAGIIYCASRKRTETIAAWLNEQGFTALPYHAGQTAEMRQRNQARFIREDGLIMVATIAFGMGIDKPDVRFVAHVDLPKSLEAYYQETGRAGRDGEPASAWLAYGLQDVVRLQQLIDQSASTAARQRIERSKVDALLAWCETTQCRRQGLLGYFGETHTGPCNNCDICLTPPQTWDGTEAAQKLLSCIYRSGQRFGAGHVLDILLGNDTSKVQEYGHQHLSTFGIGRDLSVATWRSVLRQVLVQGLVSSRPDQFGALVLTAEARPLLRGERRLQLREDVRVKQAPKTKADAKARPALNAGDEKLWEALRSCRRELALAKNLPPYVIFQDRSLHEMVINKPTTEAELLAITGVGQAKLSLYGAAFLALIRQHVFDTL